MKFKKPPQSGQGRVRHPVHRTDRETVRAGAELQGQKLYRAADIQGAPVSGDLRYRKTTESPAGRGAKEGEPETELLHGTGAELL